jgi:hypothetical protein
MAKVAADASNNASHIAAHLRQEIARTKTNVSATKERSVPSSEE